MSLTLIDYEILNSLLMRMAKVGNMLRDLDGLRVPLELAPKANTIPLNQQELISAFNQSRHISIKGESLWLTLFPLSIRSISADGKETCA